MQEQLQVTYVRILLDTLDRKQKILKEIYAVTKRQELLLKEKSKCLEVLNQLDDGFEALYKKVREELQNNPGKFQPEIEKLQGYIRGIMDLSVSIQALEQRNKLAMERYFLRHRKNIQTYRSSRQKVNTYYNTMAKFNPHQSFFMDQKK